MVLGPVLRPKSGCDGNSSWNALHGPTLIRYLGIEVDDAIEIAEKINI